MAKRLVEHGDLQPLANGLYAAPRKSRFGDLPPKPEAVMDAFLDHTPYLFTGPDYWNALGLGSTALFPLQIVYNTKRSGEFTLGGRKFLLRRVKFPERTTPEWYAVDLIEHRATVGLDTPTLTRRLRDVLRLGRLDAERLTCAAREYGTQATQRLVLEAIRDTQAAA